MEGLAAAAAADNASAAPVVKQEEMPAQQPPTEPEQPQEPVVAPQEPVPEVEPVPEAVVEPVNEVELPQEEPANPLKRSREEDAPVAAEEPAGEPEEKRAALNTAQQGVRFNELTGSLSGSSGGGVVNPLEDDDDVVAGGLNESFGEFSMGTFNPDSELEGVDAPAAPAPGAIIPGAGASSEIVAAATPHYPSGRPTLRDVVEEPVMHMQQRVLDDETLSAEEKVHKLEEVRNTLMRRREEIEGMYERDRAALERERQACEVRRVALRVQLGLGVADDPQQQRLLKMRDPTGVVLLSIEQCEGILNKLIKHKEAQPYFNKPVEPIMLGIPQYPDYVKFPMDLSTVKARLDAGAYLRDTDAFIADVRLIFRNCEIFNAPTHESVGKAMKLSKAFEALIRDPSQLNKSKSKSKSTSKPKSLSRSMGSSAASRKRLAASEDEYSTTPRPAKRAGDDFGKLQLDHVQRFCQQLMRKPHLIKTEQLSFFLEFLQTFDYT